MRHTRAQVIGGFMGPPPVFYLAHERQNDPHFPGTGFSVVLSLLAFR